MFRFPLPLPSGTPFQPPAHETDNADTRQSAAPLDYTQGEDHTPSQSTLRGLALQSRLLTVLTPASMLTLASPHYLSLAKGGLLSPASSAANPSPHLRASPGYLLLLTSDVTPRKCPPSPAQLLAALSIRSTLCFLPTGLLIVLQLCPCSPLRLSR